MLFGMIVARFYTHIEEKLKVIYELIIPSTPARMQRADSTVNLQYFVPQNTVRVWDI